MREDKGEPVARRKSRTLTEVELAFMEVVWDSGEATSETVQKGLRCCGRPLADGSVRKVLGILEAKGYLDRRPQGHGYVYWATVPRDKARRSMVQDLVDRAFGGSAALMVAALLGSDAVRRKELDQIKRLIAGREKGEDHER